MISLYQNLLVSKEIYSNSSHPCVECNPIKIQSSVEWVQTSTSSTLLSQSTLPLIRLSGYTPVAILDPRSNVPSSPVDPCSFFSNIHPNLNISLCAAVRTLFTSLLTLTLTFPPASTCAPNTHSPLSRHNDGKRANQIKSGPLLENRS